MRKLLLILLVPLFVMTACDDYDSWTTSPSAVLSFSLEEVAFDTVITAQSSTTKTLIIYNRNSKGVRIRKAALEMGSASPFRLNIDGQFLNNGEGEDFEIRTNDSIFVRIEVTLPEVGSADISKWQDNLTLMLESGTTQSIALKADGMDVKRLNGLNVVSDMTLSSPIPYLVYDSLAIQEGATLTIAPGTTLMFHSGVSALVRGTLKAEGTLEKPIVFRGDRVDRMFPYLPYDNTPNRWGGLFFYTSSYNNSFTQCDIHGGDYGIICEEKLDDIAGQPYCIRMENSVIHNVGGKGLALNNCRSKIIGTQISNTLEQCVSIFGGDHDFIHCTIAQFYPWDADRKEALLIANKQEDSEHSLVNCRFTNCVITGYADDVIMGSISENEGVAFEYLFDHSLLRTVEDKDETRYVNVTFEKQDLDPSREKHFTLFDTNNFLYDFIPVEGSIIRGMADSSVAAQYPIDRNGVNRLADGEPDAGAYEGDLKIED